MRADGKMRPDAWIAAANAEEFRYYYRKRRAAPAKSAHSTNPHRVGIKKEAKTHFQPPVSRWMVRRVVEQGQCISEKSMVQTAVTQVQPLATRSSFSCARLSNSRMLP